MYRLFQAWEVIVLASQRIALLNPEINLEKCKHRVESRIRIWVGRFYHKKSYQLSYA